METKDGRRRRCYDDNYDSIAAESNIPDMLTVYHAEETDDLKMSITGLRKNNLYDILNANNNNNESLRTECGSHPRRLLFDKCSQIPTIPYPRCNLSGNDCIKRSILYADKKPTFDRLPVIHSASFSDIDCPADEESNACSVSDDRTYSVCETDDTYTVSEEYPAPPARAKVLEKYPDSFDSDSSCLGASDEDSSGEQNRNVDKGVVDVVEKVINNYHNLLRNFYDPTSTMTGKAAKVQVKDETKIFDEIILEPPDMFSDTAAQSSDAESTFTYLPYMNPPASFIDDKNSNSHSYSFISSSPSTDNIFKSKTAIDYVINYLNQSADGYEAGKGGLSDGSTIEADDLESFYSEETDPLNGTLTEQDVRFSFESDLSTEFNIPAVLVSSSDDSPECNESETISGIPRRVRSQLADESTCETDAGRGDSRVRSSSRVNANHEQIGSLNRVENTCAQMRTFSFDSNESKNSLNYSNDDKIIENVSFNPTKVFINESFDQIDQMEILDQIDPLDSLLFDSWQPIFAKTKPLICETLEDDRESEFSTAGSSCSSFEDDGNPNDDVVDDQFRNNTKNAVINEEVRDDENDTEDDVIIKTEDELKMMKIEGGCDTNETGFEKSMTQFPNDNYVNANNLLENILTKGGTFGTTKCTICIEQNAIYDTMRELFKEWDPRCLEVILLEPFSRFEMGMHLYDDGVSSSSADAATIASCNRFLELRVDDDATSYVLEWKGTDDGGAQGCYEDDARTSSDKPSVELESSTNVSISSGRFDGMPNPSTVSEARRATATATATAAVEAAVVKDKQEESVTGGRQLTDVPVAEHGIHATMASDTETTTMTTTTTVVAGADDNSSVKNDLAECGCWKSLSNDARPDLRKWRTFPPSLGEIMRSLNSSKLDLTGHVPLSELCLFKARTSCNNERFAFAASCIDDCADFANCDGVVRDANESSVDLLCDGVNSRAVPDQPVQCCEKIIPKDDRNAVVECDTKFTNLYVNNLEAIRKFSEYFKTSLETDSKLREGIPDLNLHTDLGADLFTSSPSSENSPTPAAHCEPDQNETNAKEDVTSFILSESEESVENHVDDMKNKKKSSVDSEPMDSTEPPKPPGILKSALKRSKKFYRKKHRVQFDESLNKFFEADYVILVRDEDFEDEYRCECGNQFCYEGCYYEDEDDEDEVEFEHSVDSPRFDFVAAFDPPMEFVDPVTLSPPDGYKDGCCHDANIPSQKVSASTMTAQHENQIHRKKEASVDAENWQNFQSNENVATFNEKVKSEDVNDDGFTKRDHIRNQRYPFHGNDVNASSQLALFNDQNVQPTNGQSRYIVETITMTTVTERRIVREAANDQLKMVGDMSMMNDRGGGGSGDKYSSAAAAAAAAAGILKGGKLWRNQDPNTTPEAAKRMEMEKEDDKRSVKFIRDENHHQQQDSMDNCDSATRPVSENDKEFMLTFKLGNRVVPCNSLKPNSAVRQLFPDPRFVNPPTIMDLEDDNLGKCEGKYLVTEESLRAFNEVNKRSVFAISGKERYPYKDGNFTVHSDDEDIPQNDLIKKTIERNTLRRSLMRYPRGAGGERKRERKKRIEPSLEERIKQLTCVDDQDDQSGASNNQMHDYYRVDDPIPPRTSPPGEESHETPSKSEKSAVSSTYKKFTDLFARNKAAAAAAVAAGDNQNEHYPYYQPVYHTMTAVPAQPDLGIDYKLQSGPLMVSKQTTAGGGGGGGAGKVVGNSNEARKQFLSSLAPLTACVTGHMEHTQYGDRDTLKLKLAGDRHSITSTASTGTEYSVGDIDEALGKPEDGKAPQPDVVAGTPSGQDNQDELAMFVQQDASRIERIKKRYSNTPSNVSDDDEHDDYGFSRRPSVRGIKPRFGSTNEILQQMQAHLQQPSVPTKPGSHMTWPYYSAECGIIDKNGPNGATSPRNALPALKEEASDGSKAEYTAKVVWEKCSATGTIPRGGTVAGLQQPLKIDANNVQMFRLTPSDTITEVAVPYKCDPSDQKDLRRFPPGNVFQMKVSPVTTTQVRLPMGVPDGAPGQFTAHPIPVGTTSVIRVGHGQQQTFRVPCPVSGPVQVHLLATHPYENAQIRSSSQPIHFPPQIVVAKGTQTSTISTTSFYQLQTNTQSHYQNTANMPVSKAAGEHTTKLIQVNYNTAAQHQSPSISSLTSSPTRVKNQNHIIERGIPEGAVSSSPAFIQDCVKPPQSSPLQLTDTQNTSQNQTQNKSASLMHGMKV